MIKTKNAITPPITPNTYENLGVDTVYKRTAPE
jgi:hypothetical protein